MLLIYDFYLLFMFPYHSQDRQKSKKKKKDAWIKSFLQKKKSLEAKVVKACFLKLHAASKSC